VPDEIDRAISGNLLSLDDARSNHPQIKSHYYGEAMANVDRALNAIYQDFGFTQEEITELGQERSSTKRIPLIAKKFQEKIEAAKTAAPAAGANTEEFNRQITELNNQLAGLRTKLADTEKTYQDRIRGIQTDYQLGSRLGGLKTVYDTLPEDAKKTALKVLLEKELQDNGLVVVPDPETGALKLQRKDGSNYFDENNRQVDVDGFVNKTFAKHNVLQQTAQEGAQGGQQQQQQQQQAQGGRMVNTNNGSVPVVTGNQQQPNKMDASGVFAKRREALNNVNPTSIV
jgi:hypothetical protein